MKRPLYSSASGHTVSKTAELMNKNVTFFSKAEASVPPPPGVKAISPPYSPGYNEKF